MLATAVRSLARPLAGRVGSLFPRLFNAATDDVCPLNEQPPIGVVPKKMYASLIRPERFGDPTDAFKTEVIDVPEIGDEDVLIYVMAAGVNYNNVWAARGLPVSVIKHRQKKYGVENTEDFHVGGSDASGIVYATGKSVTSVKVGDEVVAHCGMWPKDDPFLAEGRDIVCSENFGVWGYEENWGSFAQFAKVQAHQLMPKPEQYSWEECASYMLVGATVYRMLLGWDEHKMTKDMPCLIWGGAGGLGSHALQVSTRCFIQYSMMMSLLLPAL